MILKMTSKRQVTFPREVCNALGLRPGSKLEVVRSGNSGDWTLRPVRVDRARLASLKDRVKPGMPAFDIAKFRAEFGRSYGRVRR